MSHTEIPELAQSGETWVLQIARSKRSSEHLEDSVDTSDMPRLRNCESLALE